MVAFLKLIRWRNLLIIALVQYLIRFAIIESLYLPHVLNHAYFFLGVICSIALAAGGYIINDLYDLEVDALNKPKRITIGKTVSENSAWNLYYVSVIIAIGSAYILAQEANVEDLWMIAPLAAVILYLYAYDLKARPFLGNFIVAMLSALPVFLVGVFDILPAADSKNALQVSQTMDVILAYSLFAFGISFIREMIKDAEDKMGDATAEYKTLALVLPTYIFKVIIVVLLLVHIIPLVSYSLDIFSSDKISSLYLLLFVIVPLLFLVYKSAVAQNSLDYKFISNLLKVIMLTGILSMLIFTLSLKYF
jgi:4-hydroxybenzoate polyprenyltransferase